MLVGFSGHGISIYNIFSVDFYLLLQTPNQLQMKIYILYYKLQLFGVKTKKDILIWPSATGKMSISKRSAVGLNKKFSYSKTGQDFTHSCEGEDRDLHQVKHKKKKLV